MEDEGVTLALHSCDSGKNTDSSLMVSWPNHPFQLNICKWTFAHGDQIPWSSASLYFVISTSTAPVTHPPPLVTSATPPCDSVLN